MKYGSLSLETTNTTSSLPPRLNKIDRWSHFYFSKNKIIINTKYQEKKIY